MERESAILKQEISKHETIVQPFIKDAFKEGAHRIKPKTNALSADQWFRQMMIGVVYNDIGSTATLEELAERHGTFRQSIAVSNKSFLKNLWDNSSSRVKEKYPLDEILTARKPLNQKSREKASTGHGGTSLRIKEQVASGVTEINEINKNTGISTRAISALRSTTLKDWGVNVPRKLASYKKVLKQLEEEADDKKTQELLDNLPLYVICQDIGRKKEASQFLSVGKLVREAGFHLRHNDTHFFADTLKKAGVQISIKDRVVKGARPQTLTYYILLSRHKDRAIRVLKEDQDLQRFQENPVKVLCMPEGVPIPTTNELKIKRGYEAVGKIFNELGVKIGRGSRLKYFDFFTPDCPVPIFTYAGGRNKVSYHYPVDKEEELRSFIQHLVKIL